MDLHTITVPEILLPQTDDMTAWAVNACDQFTSDGGYWKEVERLTRGKLSAYNLIFPEIYLKDEPERRIAKINSTMQSYLQSGVFTSVTDGFILVERTTQSGTRTGIVLAIDLEDYSYENGAKTPVRSTEATISERIPPRVKIRENAPVELPHIMLLYDDRENAVLESVKKGEVLYDFPLNMNGGKIKGTYIRNPDEVINAFYSLVDEKTAIKNYGVDEKLLFAVGDGNHSLATAKTCWERIKPTLGEAERRTHPARFALCEAVNIHDEALIFEPIHRLIKCADGEKFARSLNLSGGGKAYIVVNGKKREIAFPEDIPQGIRRLDAQISEYIKTNGGEVDYIHGEDELISFSPQGAGVLLPPIPKNDFFRLIISDGNLPRKTFSMGEGNEKRYYIEAKKIR